MPIFSIPHSHLTPSLGVNPFEVFLSPRLVLGLYIGEDFVILACVVLTLPACDGRTDGQTATQCTTSYAYACKIFKQFMNYEQDYVFIIIRDN